MKLIDKLSQQVAHETYTDSSFTAKNGFKVGFRKALELAAERVELGFERNDVVQDILDDIRSIGETDAERAEGKKE